MISFRVENTQRMGGWVSPPTGEQKKEPLWEIIDYLDQHVDGYDSWKWPPKASSQTLYNVKHYSKQKKWILKIKSKYSYSFDRVNVEITLVIKNAPQLEEFFALKYSLL